MPPWIAWLAAHWWWVLIALVLLLPLRGPALGAGMGGEPPQAANDSVIEGEFSRVDDPKKRLPGDQ